MISLTKVRRNAHIPIFDNAACLLLVFCARQDELYAHTQRLATQPSDNQLLQNHAHHNHHMMSCWRSFTRILSLLALSRNFSSCLQTFKIISYSKQNHSIMKIKQQHQMFIISHFSSQQKAQLLKTHFPADFFSLWIWE